MIFVLVQLGSINGVMGIYWWRTRASPLGGDGDSRSYRRAFEGVPI